jgi:hypothetical protein
MKKPPKPFSESSSKSLHHLFYIHPLLHGVTKVHYKIERVVENELWLDLSMDRRTFAIEQTIIDSRCTK